MDMGTHSRTQLERDRNTCGHTVTDTWTHMDRDRWTPRLTHGNTNIDGCRHRYTDIHRNTHPPLAQPHAHIQGHGHTKTLPDTRIDKPGQTQRFTKTHGHVHTQKQSDM